MIASLEPAAVVAAAIEHARAAWAAGDRGYLARQAAYHLAAWQDCQCKDHGCGGCQASIQIANLLEQEAAKIPRADALEGSAQAQNLWHQQRMLLKERRAMIALRAQAQEDERQARIRGDRPGRYGSD